MLNKGKYFTWLSEKKKVKISPTFLISEQCLLCKHTQMHASIHIKKHERMRLLSPTATLLNLSKYGRRYCHGNSRQKGCSPVRDDLQRELWFFLFVWFFFLTFSSNKFTSFSHGSIGSCNQGNFRVDSRFRSQHAAPRSQETVNPEREQHRFQTPQQSNNIIANRYFASVSSNRLCIFKTPRPQQADIALLPNQPCKSQLLSPQGLCENPCIKRRDIFSLFFFYSVSGRVNSINTRIWTRLVMSDSGPRQKLKIGMTDINFLRKSADADIVQTLHF